MRVLPESSVSGWVADSTYWVPRSIDTHCPKCDRQVNLVLVDKTWDHPRMTISASARCPGCDGNMSIWVVKPNKSNAGEEGCECLTIYPPNRDTRMAIAGSETLPESLRRAYEQVLQVYNAKVWSATATLCRRTLEGVVKELTGRHGTDTPLAQILRELPEKVDLGKPITALADSVRLGGNIGAHFDQAAEPDQLLARTMLDLLEYLLEYFFTIPKMIEDAKKVLTKPPAASSS